LLDLSAARLEANKWKGATITATAISTYQTTFISTSTQFSILILTQNVAQQITTSYPVNITATQQITTTQNQTVVSTQPTTVISTLISTELSSYPVTQTLPASTFYTTIVSTLPQQTFTRVETSVQPGPTEYQTQTLSASTSYTTIVSALPQQTFTRVETSIQPASAIVGSILGPTITTTEPASTVITTQLASTFTQEITTTEISRITETLTSSYAIVSTLISTAPGKRLLIKPQKIVGELFLDFLAFWGSDQFGRASLPFIVNQLAFANPIRSQGCIRVTRLQSSHFSARYHSSKGACS
jgi:hypothetical protein